MLAGFLFHFFNLKQKFATLPCMKDQQQYQKKLFHAQLSGNNKEN